MTKGAWASAESLLTAYPSGQHLRHAQGRSGATLTSRNEALEYDVHIVSVIVADFVWSYWQLARLHALGCV
jgi:hypothetical protein